MVDIARRDAPWIFGFHPKDYTLRHRWLANVKPNDMAGNTMQYLRIDLALRAELRRAWNRPVAWPVVVLLVALIASAVPAFAAYRRTHGRAARGLMLAYIVRRVLYAIPILIGVNLITFVLFFVVNTPDDMARMHLGAKRVTPEAIEKWKQEGL